MSGSASTSLRPPPRLAAGAGRGAVDAGGPAGHSSGGVSGGVSGGPSADLPDDQEISPTRAWWPWARRLLTLLFFGLVAWLLWRQARGIDWAEVAEALQARSRWELAAAAALAAASHLLYSSFDLFGRQLTGHMLPARRVMGTTFISYAFNLNLGALIGGMGFRYRLYTRQGLRPEAVTTIVATSMITNWVGYLLVGGVVLLVWTPALPADWSAADGALRAAGAAMAAAAAAWPLACALSPRRRWAWRGHRLTLPSGRVALLQVAVSSLNWMLIAGVVYLLLSQIDHAAARELGYATVLGTLLVAAVAGVITHVPAGLGVLEAVFIALLGDRIPHPDLLGALLIYRALYYLIPLALAIAGNVMLEARLKREGRAGAAVGATPTEGT